MKMYPFPLPMSFRVEEVNSNSEPVLPTPTDVGLSTPEIEAMLIIFGVPLVLGVLIIWIVSMIRDPLKRYKRWWRED